MRKPLIFAAACATYCLAVIRLAPLIGEAVAWVDQWLCDYGGEDE